MRWLDNIADSMHMDPSTLPERVKDRGTGSAVVHEVARTRT